MSALALVDGQGKILLQLRAKDGVHAGLWEFPGGKIEPGELPDMALCREAREELGLALEAAKLIPVSFASGARDPAIPGEGLVILLYLCADWQGEPQCLDGEELRWFDCPELAGLAMPPLDYPLAEALQAFLSNKSV